MPITQSRVKDLIDSATELKRLIDEFRASAESILRDPSSDGRAFAALVAETSIPNFILETLAIEREHMRLTWKRNQANAKSLARRRGRSELATAADWSEDSAP